MEKSKWDVVDPYALGRDIAAQILPPIRESLQRSLRQRDQRSLPSTSSPWRTVLALTLTTRFGSVQLAVRGRRAGD